MMTLNNLTRASVSFISKRFYPHPTINVRALSSIAANNNNTTVSKPKPRKDAKDTGIKSKSQPRRTPREEVDSKPLKPTTVLTAPRELPTRHSRHSKPPVAPKDILQEEHQKLLDAPPGTLFAYNSKNLQYNKVEEYEQGLAECHIVQQKVEYLLRGYSSMIPGSLVNDLNNDSNIMASSDSDSDKNYDDVIFKMIQLVERMELEGQAYVELRSKYRSQLARVSSSSDHHDHTGNVMNQRKEDMPADSIIDGEDLKQQNNINAENKDILQDDEEEAESIVDESTDNDAWRMNALISHYGAPPGPTNHMYDLVLDAIAVSTPSSSHPLTMLQHARSLHKKSLSRYEMDVKEGLDHLNPSSCPTPATFNAVIRASIIRTSDDQVRDYAMENAFFAFDAMYHHPVVHRNTATYRYMLEMMKALFPVGAMRGNISAAIWEQAVQDKVIDLSLFEAMKKISSQSHGDLFDEWWKKVEARFVKDVNGHGFPLIWGKNKNLRRYDRKSEVY